jgi:hypothetical protein
MNTMKKNRINTKATPTLPLIIGITPMDAQAQPLIRGVRFNSTFSGTVSLPGCNLIVSAGDEVTHFYQ